MKKIKINEEQANMLKNIDKTKVLKVTQEQYDRILETERLVEMDLNESASSVNDMMSKALPAAAENEFKNTKVPGLQNESYEAFINELYGMNEGTEKIYEKLTKLMEVAGLINSGRLVKEKFQGNKDIVRGVISAGLDEMCEGGNEYKAMEIMEEVLDLSKDYKDGEDLFKNKMDSIIDYNPEAEAKGIFNIKYINLEKTKVRNRTTLNQYILAKQGEKSYKEVWSTYRTLGESTLQEGETTKGITGNDILKYAPMSQLKKNRRDKGTEVRTINLPSTDSLDGYRTIHSQSEFTGYNIESSVGKTIEFKGYIQKFKERFNEEPIFEATPNSTLDFDVINPIYIEARDKFKGDMSAAMDSDPGLANEEEVYETDATSSGSFVGTPALSTEPINDSNVVDELINDEVAEEVNIITDVATNLLTIIDRAGVDPNDIVDSVEEIAGILASLEGYNDLEDTAVNQKFQGLTTKLPKMISLLIIKAEDAMEGDGITNDYIDYVRDVYSMLSVIKRTAGPVMEDEVSETTTTGSVGGQYATSGFLASDFMGTKGKEGGAPVKTSVKPYMKGAKEVKIKDKCSKFPYCNQGPDALAESIAKKTGRDIEEVKQIIENFNQK